jgi:hypothetical protein
MDHIDDFFVEKVEHVVDTFEKNNIGINIENIQMGSVVKILGFVRDGEGLRHDPEKLGALKLAKNEKKIERGSGKDKIFCTFRRKFRIASQ